MTILQTLGLHVIRGEIYLCACALFLLLYGVYKAPRAGTNLVLVSVMILTLVGFLVYDGGIAEQSIFNSMLVSNAFTVFSKLLIITAAILSLLLATNWLEGRNFEYAVLVLLSTLGMMLMVSSGSLLALYMAIELMSLPLYVLASFDRDNKFSTEAGLKYFVLGSLASGFILFGASLIYGFSGTISFEGLATLLSGGEAVSKAMLVGFIFVIVGFCFKLSAAPFHMWTPDVYEGAPTPVTAFFSIAPKVAVMALLMRILFEPFMALQAQWQQVIIAAALLSMTIGAFAAIAQSNIKRLLAYSSIGHIGFMFLGLACGSLSGLQAVLVYLALYVFMSAGMFACVIISGYEKIKDFSGLAKTKPLLAAAIAANMFAMAGIPPLSGFFGKMMVLLAALKAGMLWLAVFGVIVSVVGCYYYLKIIKIMYFDEAVATGGNSGSSENSSSSPLLVAVAIIGSLVTVGFFLVPDPLLESSLIAAQALVK